jgi:hypothetical protein
MLFCALYKATQYKSDTPNAERTFISGSIKYFHECKLSQGLMLADGIFLSRNNPART